MKYILDSLGVLVGIVGMWIVLYLLTIFSQPIGLVVGLLLIVAILEDTGICGFSYY